MPSRLRGINRTNITKLHHYDFFRSLVCIQFYKMEQYAFCKKMSAKGNLEMRTMFGRNMALIITKVNGFFYVNLYNNNPRNPGRCSLGWDEFQEMVAMKNVLEHLQPQFDVSFFLDFYLIHETLTIKYH